MYLIYIYIYFPQNIQWWNSIDLQMQDMIFRILVRSNNRRSLEIFFFEAGTSRLSMVYIAASRSKIFPLAHFFYLSEASEDLRGNSSDFYRSFMYLDPGFVWFCNLHSNLSEACASLFLKCAIGPKHLVFQLNFKAITK